MSPAYSTDLSLGKVADKCLCHIFVLAPEAKFRASDS